MIIGWSALVLSAPCPSKIWGAHRQDRGDTADNKKPISTYHFGRRDEFVCCCEPCELLDDSLHPLLRIFLFLSTWRPIHQFQQPVNVLQVSIPTIFRILQLKTNSFIAVEHNRADSISEFTSKTHLAESRQVESDNNDAASISSDESGLRLKRRVNIDINILRDWRDQGLVLL